MPLPTRFSGFTLSAGPKHSISVPLSAGAAVPLSVEVKEVAVVPNPAPGVAVKTLPGPQIVVEFDRCTRIHSMLSFSLQMVSPLVSPVTLQVKVNESPGQVRGAEVNCPVTAPGDEQQLHPIE